ncbi:MAG TPA: hypothetical protein VJY62_00890 [Bacteroidia bacterium]|nr:hypothetical protein [Bacteroidia bacterium]
MMSLPSKKIRRILLFAIIVSGFAFSPIENGVKQKTEIVLCLDLSASTNGLLHDIRDHLWQFINKARKDFPQTDLRIGVVAFARPSFGAENHYVKVLCDITGDYDLLSYYLFLLKANIEKGDQCDGSALYAALKDLHWSKDAATKKMIYLFGNSNPKMCGYDHLKACETAAKENIPVHAVYCTFGAVSVKYLPVWQHISETTGGDFYTFQITGRTPLKKFSRDALLLAELNNNLLDTYLPFTREGKLHFDLMVAADENSKKMNEQFFYERCSYKFSSYFEDQCRQWDLVTLLKTTSLDPGKLSRHYLPQEFQNTTPKELEEIARIKIKRREFLKKKMLQVLLNSDIDNIQPHPIDTILLGGLDKKTNYVVSKFDQK